MAILAPGALRISGILFSNSRFQQTLKHEVTHRYVGALNEKAAIWLIEGICTYAANQTPDDVSEQITIEKLESLHGLTIDPKMYSLGWRMVDSIIKGFSKEKLFELIAIEDKEELYSELRKMFEWLK